MPEDKDKSEETNKQLYEQLGKICDDNNIQIACFLASKDEQEQPMLWYRGDMISAAKIAAKFVRLVKKQITQQLELEI